MQLLGIGEDEPVASYDLGMLTDRQYSPCSLSGGQGA